eukprot:TRINITY_DN8061_c0_g1_i1.p1 TRINITY_DN8061_c0_g1~~TRINITY_DN8061_c0_g1_i1.p1  ORF type:complete len:740 (+),score=153.38 TRINITY_DN8061_c0_g1_i1:177-2396(+)
MDDPDLDFLKHKAPSPPTTTSDSSHDSFNALLSESPTWQFDGNGTRNALSPAVAPKPIQPGTLPAEVPAEMLSELYNTVMSHAETLEAMFASPPPDYRPTSIVQSLNDEPSSTSSPLQRVESTRTSQPSATAVDINISSVPSTPSKPIPTKSSPAMHTLSPIQSLDDRLDESINSEVSVVVHDEQPTWESMEFKSKARKGSYRQPWIVPYTELELGRVIGSGGFSTVSKGRWRGELVAVKQLLCGDRTPAKMEDMLTSEAELLNKLRHKHIIDFKAACVEPPHFCIVLEYAAKGPLTKHIRETLEPSRVVSWAQQLAKGMVYLHDEAPVTVIHRDLKPSNILITADDVLKITDFGLAKHHTHTTRMSAGGTYTYMAPECIKQSLFSKASDVWAYGVVLWSILTAEVPYQGVEGLAVAYGVASNNLTLPIPDDCYQPFDTLLKQCWQRDIKDRPSFASIITTLQNPATGRFMSVPRGTFKIKQSSWTPQIAALTARLKAQEMALTGREEELQRLAQVQQEKEAELERRERMLQQREQELRSREVRGQLEASPVLQHKEERRGLLGRLKKRRNTSQTDLVSSPTNFRHVVHVGHDDAMTQDISQIRERIESVDLHLSVDNPRSRSRERLEVDERIGRGVRRRGKLLRPFKRSHGRSRSDATNEIRLTHFDEASERRASDRLAMPFASDHRQDDNCNPVPRLDRVSSAIDTDDINKLPTRRRNKEQASVDGSQDERPRSFSM